MNEQTKIAEDNRRSDLNRLLGSFARWFIINAIGTAVVVLAVFYDYGWARNILIFGAIVLMLMQGLAAIGSVLLPDDELKLKIAKDVPHWVDATYDITIILILVATGWIFTAAVWTIQTFFCAIVYSRAKSA